MSKTLREVWRHAIRAADYDAHMRAAGQAEANARLVDALLRRAPPPAGAPILVAGAGTGQMFDYLDPAALHPFHATFTDINAGFLERLTARLAGDPALRFETRIDDVEASALEGPFALAIAVLVLEHVEWPKAVATLCRLASRVFVVIQETPPDAPAVRTPVGSVAVLLETPPHAVELPLLEAAFADAGFARTGIETVSVPDGKRMIALEFTAAAG